MPANLTQCVTIPPTAPILSHMVVAMAIELSDESCPPMRYLHHSNQSDSLFMLTVAHLPTNLSVFGFRTCTPHPRTHTRDPNESADVQL